MFHATQTSVSFAVVLLHTSHAAGFPVERGSLIGQAAKHNRPVMYGRSSAIILKNRVQSYFDLWEAIVQIKKTKQSTALWIQVHSLSKVAVGWDFVLFTGPLCLLDG